MKPASDISESIPANVLEEAAGWFANFADAPPGDTDRRRLQAWLDAHPDHVRAWKRVEEITGRFGAVVDAGKPARDALVARHRSARRRALKALCIFAIAGAGSLATLRLPWSRWRQDLAINHADHRTRIGETIALVLDDGSRVWLGASSALDVSFTASLRSLSLFRGDLLVETGHDVVQPPRPFVVRTGHGNLRALGTRFAVRSDSTDSRVDVFAGAVEVTLGSAANTFVVDAGTHAIFDATHVKATGPADPGRESWSRGILLADRMRLDVLVAELGRWHPQSFACAPEACALQVVGAYPLKDLDHILDALKGSLPVRISRENGTVTIFAAAPVPQSGTATQPSSVPARRPD